MRYAFELQNFFWHAISRKRLEIGIYLRGTKNRKLRLLSSGSVFNNIRWPTHEYTIFFLSRDAMLARYILGDGPVLVRPSVRLGAEGPRDAKSWRGTRVATSYMRLIATAAQQWRGRCIHAACCYRCAAVSRSVHPHGLLLLGLWSNNRAALPCFSSLLHVYCCKYNYWHG